MPFASVATPYTIVSAAHQAPSLVQLASSPDLYRRVAGALIVGKKPNVVRALLATPAGVPEGMGC